jgi:hypothetical protein
MVPDFGQDRCESSDAQTVVIRDRDVMFTLLHRGQPEVAAGFPGDFVPKLRSTLTSPRPERSRGSFTQR